MSSSTLVGNLVIRPARSIWAILLMRIVRNQVCEFMTGNNKPISFWEQVNWYYGTYKDNPNYRGYLAKERGRTVGYGLLVKSNGEWNVTAGFTKEARGKGYGRRMFAFLGWQVFQMGEKYVYLQVLTTNTGAIALYRSLDYKLISRRSDNNVLTMRCKSPLVD